MYMYICYATMAFTVEDRYLPLPTYRTLKVLHLAKKEIHRLTAAKCATNNHLQSTELSSMICDWSARLHVDPSRAATTR